MANSRILVISDIHSPFMHPDTVRFLKSLKNKYKPDRIILTGDEVDGHAISFHEKDPDLFSPKDELALAIKRLRPIYKLFPVADVLESNHGSLVYRRGKFAGLSRSVFKSYREILEAPKKWAWHFDLTIRMSNGQSLYCHHGKSSKQGALSKTMGMCSLQGHYHESFHITYWANSLGIYWDMHVGSLVDRDSLAMAYAKNNLRKPIIGLAVILNGLPKLLPMVLKKNGRWNGDVP